MKYIVQEIKQNWVKKLKICIAYLNPESNPEPNLDRKLNRNPDLKPCPTHDPKPDLGPKSNP